MSLLHYIRYGCRQILIRRSIIKKGGVIGNNVKLSIAGDCSFGEDVVLNSEGIDLPNWSHITVDNGAYLEIGNHSGLSQFVINCKERIVIGKYVNVGAGCLIIDSNHHSLNWETRRNRSADKNHARTAPIIIRDDVFIGARCIICKGVTIGARSVIAAGSVVVNDIPENCIAGGNPCKKIKDLNS